MRLVILFVFFSGTILSGIKAQVIDSNIEVSNITQNALTLSWTNNGSADSYIRYGYTRNLELGELTIGNSSSPEIEITGLNPAQFVYVQAIADNGTQVNETDTLVFISASASTGQMKVYFNRPVNIDYANSAQNHAVQLLNLIDDTLIEYINRAQESIDISVYNLASASGISDISGAINAAFDRGVRVRVIYNEDTGNSGVAALNSFIPKLISPVPEWPNGHGLMHNKFLIFDAESSNPNLPIVWTGSTNLTTQQINTDANNVIIIQDQALARTYKLEFEEMWGGNADLPNATDARFGPFKKDNTPHVLSINGKRVESYFSPSDGVTSRIVNAINDAADDICINTMLITREDIANAIVFKDAIGVYTRVMVNSVGETTVWDQLETSLGVNLANYSTVTGTLHHKLMMANAVSGVDSYVLTGSHNWSTSAENRNDENTLVIYDEDIVNQYYQEFMGRFGPIASVTNFDDFQAVAMYPNPSNGNVTIAYSSALRLDAIVVLNSNGQEVSVYNSGLDQEFVVLDLSSLSKGVYFIEFISADYREVRKLVIQ